MLRTLAGLWLTGITSLAPQDFPGSAVPLPTEAQLCVADPLEEVRIGRKDGSADYIFGQIEDVAIGPDGSIFVADLHPQSIRQYDPSGSFVRRIGREGQGPGEYRSILGLETMPEGSLAVWDFGNRRISIYDRMGDFRRGIPARYGIYASEAFHVDSAGRFYIKTHTAPPTLLPNGGFGAFTFGYVRVAPDGSVLDTLPLPQDNPTGTFSLTTESGSLRPFPTEEIYALGPRGELVVGANDRYRFVIPSETGPTVVEDTAYRPVPVLDDEHAEWEDLRKHLEREAGMSFPPIPQVKPAFRDLWLDSDGRVWVHRYAAAVMTNFSSTQRTRSGIPRPNVTWREPQLRDVFAPDGTFITCVEFSRSARPMESRGTSVWGVVRGEFDEEYVVRWSVPQLSGA